MARKTSELVAKLTDQVSGPAKSMAGALKGTSTALDALKAKAGQLDAFKKASRDLDEASQKFKQAQQNVRRIKQEMDAAGDGGKKLASSLKSAERAAEAAKNAFKNQGQTVREMRAALEQAGMPINKLAANERQLRMEIEKTTAALSKQKTAVGAALGPGSGGAARGTGALAEKIAAAKSGGGFGLGAMTGAGATRFGLAAAGIGGAAYVVGDQIRHAAQSSMSFEKAMIEVGKATDTQGAELDTYGNKLLRLSRQTGRTKEDLASMLSQAGFAGRPKEELMDFTEYAAKATVAWGTSAEETGQAMAELGNIYGANQKRIEEMGDAINAMADNSASRESDLLEFLRRAGASGKDANIPTEDMLAFGAAMKEVGVRNETAGTAMEAFLNVMKLGEEFSKKAGKGLKALGVDSDKMRKSFVAKPVETMVGLLEKLNKVTDPLKKAEIMTDLFGKEYQDDMAKLLNALPQINRYLGLMRDKAAIARSSVRGQFAQNIDKDVQKIAMATAAIDEAYKRLGDPVKMILGSYADAINKAADRLDKGDTPLQRLLKRLESQDKPGELEDGKKPPEGERSFHGRLVTKAIGLFDPESARAAAANDLALAERARFDSVKKVAELEKEIAASKAKSIAAGATEAQAEAALRNKRAELRQAKTASAVAEKDEADAREAVAKLDKKPLRMGQHPLDPIRGQPGAITPGTKAWQEMYPLTRNVPLPPMRPGGLEKAAKPTTSFGLPAAPGKGIGSIDEVLGPKVDASQVDGLGTKADAAKGKLSSLETTVTPHVNLGELQATESIVDRIIGKLAQIGGAAANARSQLASMNVGQGPSTGRTAQAIQNRFSDAG